MPIFFKYLSIGLLVSFIFEALIQKVSGENFTWGERTFMVVLWPLALVVFLIGFFKNQ